MTDSYFITKYILFVFVCVRHLHTHIRARAHTLFKGHSSGKPGLAGFPFDSHTRGFEARSLYEPGALPVAKPTASNPVRG